jgi:hypothetical protein
LGSKKGTRLETWEEAVEATGQGRGGFVRKAQERRERFERIFRSRIRRKALKGEAQECWRLKEASEGRRKRKRREGSQTQVRRLLIFKAKDIRRVIER